MVEEIMVVRQEIWRLRRGIASAAVIDESVLSTHGKTFDVKQLFTTLHPALARRRDIAWSGLIRLGIPFPRRRSCPRNTAILVTAFPALSRTIHILAHHVIGEGLEQSL